MPDITFSALSEAVLFLLTSKMSLIASEVHTGSLVCPSAEHQRSSQLFHNDMLSKMRVCAHMQVRDLILRERPKVSTPLSLSLCLITAFYPIKHKSNPNTSTPFVSSPHNLQGLGWGAVCVCVCVCVCVSVCKREKERDLVWIKDSCVSLTSDFGCESILLSHWPNLFKPGSVTCVPVEWKQLTVITVIVINRLFGSKSSAQNNFCPNHVKKK